MKTKENIFIIKGRLIDGCHDTCIEKGAVADEGERIVYAGEERGCPLSGYPVYEAENGTIMPGMIDCHAHLSGEESQNRQGGSAYDSLLAAAHDIGILVDAGITGVRDKIGRASCRERV